mgnify:CR=1 FL=1|jgi:hypothetical protein
MSEKLLNYIVNILYDILCKIDIPTKIKILLLKSFHINLPIYFILLMLSFTQKYCNILIIIWIALLILFLYFNECIFSKLEQKLIKNNIDAVDGIIYFLKLKCNHENRYIIGIYVYMITLLIMSSIYIIRFRFIFNNVIYK